MYCLSVGDILRNTFINLNVLNVLQECKVKANGLEIKALIKGCISKNIHVTRVGLFKGV